MLNYRCNDQSPVFWCFKYKESLIEDFIFEEKTIQNCNLKIKNFLICIKNWNTISVKYFYNKRK